MDLKNWGSSQYISDIPVFMVRREEVDWKAVLNLKSLFILGSLDRNGVFENTVKLYCAMVI